MSGIGGLHPRPDALQAARASHTCGKFSVSCRDWWSLALLVLTVEIQGLPPDSCAYVTQAKPELPGRRPEGLGAATGNLGRQPMPPCFPESLVSQPHAPALTWLLVGEETPWAPPLWRCWSSSL